MEEDKKQIIDDIKKSVKFNLEQIKELAISSMEKADLQSLEELRVSILGKKGELTSILRNMDNLSNEHKPIVGKMANEIRKFIETNLENAKKALTEQQQANKISSEHIDVTMKGNKVSYGNKHPMTKVIDEIKNIFIGLGFEIAEGPDIETDYYNFEALNIPKNHPAKDEQDTFYIEGGFVLRTQTSPVQIRTMEKGELPIYVIAPGRVFRSDEVDATHSPVFHQLEGLVIDKNISMSHLKGSLILFAKQLFGEKTEVRFRPHHFPFTEPSAEMDVSCFACSGSGCRVCKNSGWIEILGCGMVHPNVLEMSNIDATKYSGFAFGMGLERIAMQRYGISDLRLMYENDIKFIKQF
jgi:phenylalanyl-tRNA synthetase alpha chain